MAEQSAGFLWLGGSAVINGSVNNTGANIIPGSTTSPGLMSVDGTYTQGFGGKLTEVLNGAGGPPGVGTAYSQLGATGDIALGGTLAITTLSNPAVGDLDTIVATNGALSGNFASVTDAFTPGSSFCYEASYGSNYAALTVGPTLRVTKSGVVTGTVASSPGGINCGSTCFALFFGVQNVTLSTSGQRLGVRRMVRSALGCLHDMPGLNDSGADRDGAVLPSHEDNNPAESVAESDQGGSDSHLPGHRDAEPRGRVAASSPARRPRG